MKYKTPSYRLHKPSGQAVVTIGGRDFYLGKFGTPASRSEYDRLIAEWLQNGRVLPATNDLTVNELLVGYIRHCDGYYRRTDGTPTSEADSIRQSIRLLKEIYGHTLAHEFGSVKLKVCREAMIDADLCRNECNKRTRRIVRAFGWAVENQLVPASIWDALRAVKGLRKGKSRARETKKVRPVSDERINAAIPFVLPPIEAMIRIQRLTGMRSGEVVSMRVAEIDTTPDVWLYRPEQHKTEYLDHERIVAFGPRAQEVLAPWMQREPNKALFSPREAIEQLRADMREKRKTKVQPSQRNRKKRKPKRQPSDQYTTHSYGNSIRRACKKAGIAMWHPHQIRHTRAKELREEFGIETARVILGHRSPQMTEHYAQLDIRRAIETMAKVG